MKIPLQNLAILMIQEGQIEREISRGLSEKAMDGDVVRILGALAFTNWAIIEFVKENKHPSAPNGIKP